MTYMCYTAFHFSSQRIIFVRSIRLIWQQFSTVWDPITIKYACMKCVYKLLSEYICR